MLNDFLRRVNPSGLCPKDVLKIRKCASCYEDATEFKDEISAKEYNISGLCQKCQDKYFVEEQKEEFMREEQRGRELRKCSHDRQYKKNWRLHRHSWKNDDGSIYPNRLAMKKQYSWSLSEKYPCYSQLRRILASYVGQNWQEVHKLLLQQYNKKADYRIREEIAEFDNSGEYWNNLYIDDNGVLRQDNHRKFRYVPKQDTYITKIDDFQYIYIIDDVKWLVKWAYDKNKALQFHFVPKSQNYTEGSKEWFLYQRWKFANRGYYMESKVRA